MLLYTCNKCGIESTKKSDFNIFKYPIPGWGFSRDEYVCKKCTEKIRRRADYLDALSLMMENYYKTYSKEA